jgi:protoporphyrinogen oxidase
MSLTAREHWGVLGGGLLGMTLAHRLSEQGKRVTLCESARELGGLACAWELGGLVWDRHYHVVLLSDLRLRGLLQELDLEREISWVQTRTGFYTDGRLHSMSNTLEFLRFEPLGLLDKLRLGATIFHAARVKDWKKLEQIPAGDWLRRWSGRRTFEKIWLPLLRAKLGENHAKASAAFIWAIIARMYAARRTGLKKEMFGYVPGGYARILRRFGERLAEDGVAVRLGHAAARVSQLPDGRHRVEFANGARETFDRVVLTMAAPQVARLCPTLTQKERDRLRGVEYQGIVCASVLSKKPLSPYYVTNITEPWVPFTAVIEMTALVEPGEFGGNSLVFLPKYVSPDDPSFEESDESIQGRFLEALGRMHPGFQRSDVLAFRVSRVRYVLAISTLDYSSRVPAMTTTVGGLYVVNSSQIVNGTLNVNETVTLAEKAAEALAGSPGAAVPFPHKRAV